VDGFRRSADFRPHRQGKIATYARVRTFLSLTDSTQIRVQYQPLVPWVDDCRITLIADDQCGLQPAEVEKILVQCAQHKVTAVELAMDFDPDAGIDEEFVMKHGRFGKSRLKKGMAGQLRFGSRASPKMVRFYPKPSVRSFRVEIEAHSSLVRKYSSRSARDLGSLAWKLSQKHVQFATVRWSKLRPYLCKRVGPSKAEAILDEAADRGEKSLRRAIRYLSSEGVPNPHRFLRPMAINQDIRQAFGEWAEWWYERMYTDDAV